MANWKRGGDDKSKEDKFFIALRGLVREKNLKIEEDMRLVRGALQDPYVIRNLLSKRDKGDEKKRYPIHYLVEALINFEKITQKINSVSLSGSPEGRVLLDLYQAVRLVRNNRDIEQMSLQDADGKNTLNRIYADPATLHMIGSNTLSNFTHGLLGNGALLDIPFCSIKDGRGVLPIHSLLEAFNSENEGDINLVTSVIITLVRAGNPSLCGTRAERDPEIFTKILNAPSPISGKTPLQIIIEKGLTQAFIAGCEGYLPHSVGPFSLPVERSKFDLKATSTLKAKATTTDKDEKPLYNFLLDRYCSALEGIKAADDKSEALELRKVNNKYGPMLECAIRVADDEMRNNMAEFISKRAADRAADRPNDSLTQKHIEKVCDRVSALQDRVLELTTPNPSVLRRAFQALTGGAAPHRHTQ